MKNNCGRQGALVQVENRKPVIRQTPRHRRTGWEGKENNNQNRLGPYKKPSCKQPPQKKRLKKRAARKTQSGGPHYTFGCVQKESTPGARNHICGGGEEVDNETFRGGG